nr:GATA transcription factor 7 [Ipomoea batatas]
MGWDASSGWNSLEPDYFGFYKCEIAELLSEDEDFLPSSLQTPVSAENFNGNKTSHYRKEYNSASSSSLFSNCIGPEVSGIKMGLLKSLLRQGVFALSEEVDEKVDVVFNICRLQSFLRFNESLITSSSAGSDFDQGNPCKKLKPSTLSSPASECQSVSASRGEISNNAVNRCSESHTEAPQLRSSPEGTKPFHNACKLDGNKGTQSLLMNERNRDCLLDINVGAAKEDQDVDDLPFLLQNDSSTVGEVLKKHSDDLSVMLEQMEQKLEELLDIVMSKCRLMTLSEKQQLQRMIKNLPPRNLDSVVKIIQRHRQSNVNENSCHEIHIDLEKEDNVTLWRLYFYIEAVENAKKLRNG